MTRQRSMLERFVRRVHRRWVVLCAIESAGVGAAVGCAAALALVPVLLWRDQPATGVALMLIAVTCAAGLIFGLTRRPTLLAAAVEADRQLGLHDLLATALATRDADNDPWAAAVVAQADARCRVLSPDAILLNRLGVRAWSGIGIAAALVMTLSLMSTRPERLSAAERANVAQRSIARTPSPVDVIPSGVERDEDGGRTTGSSVASRDSIEPHPDPDDSSASQIASNNRSTSAAGGSSGVGLGAAQTNDSAVRSSESPRSSLPPKPNTSGDAGRETSGGGGAGHVGRGDARDVIGAGATNMEDRAAPWTSSDWSDVQRAATDAVQSGRVPDAYRELIRDYFAPDASSPSDAEQPH